MAKLKVFGWSDGLRAYAVAVTSRAKALEAWGIRQNLFKTGDAQEIDDADLVRAAMAQPGVVIAKAVRGGGIKAVAAAKPPEKPNGPTAQERKIAKLREEVSALDDQHDRDLEAIAGQRRALDEEEESLTTDYDQAREDLASRLAAAKKG